MWQRSHGCQHFLVAVMSQKENMNQFLRIRQSQGPYQLRQALARPETGSTANDHGMGGNSELGEIGRPFRIPLELMPLVNSDHLFRIEFKAEKLHIDQILAHTFGDTDNPVNTGIQKPDPGQGRQPGDISRHTQVGNQLGGTALSRQRLCSQHHMQRGTAVAGMNDVNMILENGPPYRPQSGAVQSFFP